MDSCSQNSTCHSHKKRFDYLLWVSFLLVFAGYTSHLLLTKEIIYFSTFSHSCFELMNRMWWGLALGITFVGLLSEIPREFITKVIGRADSFSGIIRATIAGMMLDLCSHGILLVGTKLYERGAGIGQVMAFLIASPWNSISLTIILMSLIGLKWTLLFILLSAIIAIISGVIFNILVRKNILPSNPNSIEHPSKDFHFWKEAKKQLSAVNWSIGLLRRMALDGLRESRMILRWILFGVVLASLVRTFIDTENFQTLFGPTMAGLGLTLIAATIIEVCSEGSSPIAADILTRGNAPGNSFAFLMTGISTDYTEIMVLREATKSWKIAFFLPLVTLPQVIAISVIINYFGN